MADKRQLRLDIKQKLEKLTDSEKEKMSQVIFNKVSALEEYKRAKSVFCFMSDFNEPYSIDFIKKAIRLGKKVYVPKTDDGNMSAVEVDEDTEFWFNKYGILEPKDGHRSEDIDFTVVPMVGFDSQNNRLGHGKAYYDKFLSKVKTYKCGVAFGCQKIDVPFAESCDVPLDMVITDESN